MGRLFVFDLDGTLLGPDHRLPRETVEFLTHELVHRHRFTIATGRSLASTRPFLQELGVGLPAILYNGAVIYDPVVGKVLWESRLPLEMARGALKVARSFPVHPEVYRDIHDPNLYVDHITPAIVAFQRKEGLPAVEVGDLLSFLDFSPLKLLLIGPPKVLLDLETKLRGALPQAEVVRSERDYLEVLPPGVSKGEGLRRLCRLLGVSPEEVVAVGDQLNDLGMLEVAGIGVAMAHAPEALRRRAKLVIQEIAELAALL
ncbi:HAD family phosphatase [Candidatus Bipolaricaulota bacterium]|nr:HAD family phosphatase [Candidatus Bipolaricaulota bacterium]